MYIWLYVCKLTTGNFWIEADFSYNTLFLGIHMALLQVNVF